MTDARSYALAAFATAVEPWIDALRSVQAKLQSEGELLEQRETKKKITLIR